MLWFLFLFSLLFFLLLLFYLFTTSPDCSTDWSRTQDSLTCVGMTGIKSTPDPFVFNIRAPLCREARTFSFLCSFPVSAHLYSCLMADEMIRYNCQFSPEVFGVRGTCWELIGWEKKVLESKGEARSWSDGYHLFPRECELVIWKRGLSCFSHTTLHVWWSLLAHKILSISQGTLCFCSWLLLFLELFGYLHVSVSSSEGRQSYVLECIYSNWSFLAWLSPPFRSKIPHFKAYVQKMPVWSLAPSASSRCSSWHAAGSPTAG